MDLFARLDKIEDFPTIPTSFARILKVVEDINSGFEDLVEVIRTDSALAAKVLKVANSPVYGATGKIIDLHRAAALLGFREIRFIALGLSAFDSMIRKVKGAYFQRQRFWTHSYSCAYIAQSAASRLGLENDIHAFVAGLLHDMGRVILDRYFPEYLTQAIEVSRKEKLSLLDCEIEIAGVGHDKIGAYVANRWQLPDELGAAVRHHHNADDDAPDLAWVTLLADRISHSLGIHTLPFEPTPKPEELLGEQERENLERRFTLTPDGLDLLIAQLQQNKSLNNRAV